MLISPEDAITAPSQLVVRGGADKISGKRLSTVTILIFATRILLKLTNTEHRVDQNDG